MAYTAPLWNPCCALSQVGGSVRSSVYVAPVDWLDTLHVLTANAVRGLVAVRVGGRVANLEELCIAWRKSTASNTSGCLEAATVGGSVLIRDSGNRDGVVLRFPPVAWSAFLARAWVKDSRRT